MTHLEEVQVSKGFWESASAKEKEVSKTDEIPSGSYAGLEQSALWKVRQEKLQEYLEAKQRFDEVETEVRTRAWRRSLKEKGDDLQARIERQQLEAEALGVFRKDEGGVRGAPRDSSFSKRRTSRAQVKPLIDESAVLAFLDSLEVD
jgi:hypothetical protein